MGVIKFTPDMNESSNGTDVSVPSQRSLSLSGENLPLELRINCNLQGTDDLDMKLKFGGGSNTDVSPSKKDGTSNLCDGVVNGHELSVSLPNLNDGDDISLKTDNCKNEKNVRSSLSDIYDNKLSPGSVILSSPNSSVNSTSCLLSKSPEPLETSPNEKHSLLSKDRLNSSDEQSPLKTNSSPAKVGEVTVTMDGSANRLSAVLENIPLFYLPQTKQLISSPEHQKMSAAENSLDATDSAEVASPVPKAASCSQAEDSSNSRIVPVNSDPDHAEGIVIGGPSATANTNGTSSEPAVLEASGGACPPSLEGSESECSTLALSQDSDSFRAVRSHPPLNSTQQSQGKTDSRSLKSSDFDEISLSRVSIDRDSPKNTLHRANTIGSLPLGDGSSFSSISSISTSTDFSISTTSYTDDFIEIRAPTLSSPVEERDGAFVDVSLNARNSYERSRNSSMDSGIDEKQCHSGAKPKRRGLSGFFTRSLFSRKGKETSDNAGWKLFGRVPPKSAPQPTKDPNRIQEEYAARLRETQLAVTRAKKSDVEVLSTTALILENRPQGLPSKDPEEEMKHKLEYEAMVEAAKKKELKEAKRRKKRMAEQLRHEEELAAALKVWNTEILKDWDTMSTSKKAKDLWWLGIPPSVRGRVWKLAIGNDLNLTAELYEICLARAKERFGLLDGVGGDTDSIHSNLECEASREASVELIKLDVSRTFPQLCIFQKGGPYHELLQGLLGAYACYRPDVGYVQGMSFIAAVLLLNMDVDDAFCCFANLLNRPCQIAFFRLDESLMKSYFATYEEFFFENLPKLHAHFEKQGLTPDLYIIDWMFTLYAKSLPLDLASRVWDIFCRDGEEFLFRTALGVLAMYEEILLNMDFIHLAQFLTRLPESMSAHRLFRHIDAVNMNIDKRRFGHVLAEQKDVQAQREQDNKGDA